MNELTATAVIPSVLRGTGSLERAGHSTEVIFTIARDKYALAQPWRLEATTVAGHNSLHDVLRAGDLNDPITLRGNTEGGGRLVRIDRIPLPRTTGGVLISDVWRFDVLDKELGFSPTEWYVTVYLTDTPLVTPETSRIRDPRGFHEETGERKSPVSFQVAFGSVEFSQWLAFENVRTGTAKGQLDILHPSIRLSIPASENASFQFVIDLVEDWLSSFLRVLGFLGRKRVMWTKIGLIAHSKDEHGWFEAKRNQIAADTSVMNYIEPFVLANGFTEAVSDGFVDRYFNHPASSEIATCIDLLTVSRETVIQFSSHRFISAFTAFEMIINAYGDANGLSEPLSSKQQKELFKRVRAAIREYSSQFQLKPELLSALIQRVPELGRLGLVTRALAVLQELRITVVDLFPPGFDLAQELRAIAKRRNALVHAGADVDIATAFPDEVRLNLLTERILFAWIGGKPEWISPLEERNNAWLKRH